MDKRIVIGYGVASLFMLGVILLAVLPFPQAATPTPAVRQLAAPTSQYATNFTAINAEEVDATTLNATTGNVTTLNSTTANITTLNATTVISEAADITLSGVLTIAAGAVTTPSLTFADDPNTGLYRVGADDIGLTAGGVKSFDCTAAGCTTTGTQAVTGATTLTGALAANGNLKVAVPTAIASATPAARISNTGANNDSLVIEKNATPVLKVGNGGQVTGYILANGTYGQKVICGTENITGTAVIAHGFATPSYVMANLAGDPVGNYNLVTYTNASATVTVKVWGLVAATPVPNTTPVAVGWCVIGTP